MYLSSKPRTVAQMRPASGGRRSRRLAFERLTQLVAREAPHVDLLAHLQRRLANQIVDRLVSARIANVRLLEQARFLVKFLELALDDLRHHRGRLALGLRRINLPLLLDDRCRHFLAPHASIYEPTDPSDATRPARPAAAAIPFSRSQTTAFSRSPDASDSARLQSMMPAPVFSRSSLT